MPQIFKKGVKTMTRQDKLDRVEISDKSIAKDAIAHIVGEIQGAQEEKRNSKISKKEKELALAYWDEFKSEKIKFKTFLFFVIAGMSITAQSVIFDGYLGQATALLLFTFVFSYFLEDEYSEVGYIRKHIPSLKTKTRDDIELFTFSLFGFVPKFKPQAIFMTVFGFFTLSFLISNFVKEDFYNSVFNSVLTIVLLTIVIFFDNFYTQKVK